MGVRRINAKRQEAQEKEDSNPQEEETSAQGPPQEEETLRQVHRSNGRMNSS
jgi:hypothetical protein